MGSHGKPRRRVHWLVVVGLMMLAVPATGAWLVTRWMDPLRPARQAYARGDWSTALRESRTRLKTQPQDEQALRIMARASARLSRDESAQAIYARLGAEGAEAEDFHLLGRTLLRQGRDDQAMLMLERARKADSEHAETLDALAGLYAEHDFPLAAADAAERLKRNPKWEARALARLGRLQSSLVDPAGAAESFSRLLRLDPDGRRSGLVPEETRKLEARALLRLGKTAEARAVLEPLSSDVEAAWLRSRSWIQDGNAAQARTSLKAAGDFGHDDPAAHEPAPYVGAAACASCHPAIFKRQRSSRHAHSIARSVAPVPPSDRSIADPADAKVTHTFRRTAEAVEIETRIGEDVRRSLLEYAFGSGHRAVTLVVRDQAGEAAEFRLSHYGGAGWDLTIGHEAHPTVAAEFVGKHLIPDRVRGCRNCHATNYRAAAGPSDYAGPEAADGGIGCERCHGPGGNHVAAVAMKLSDVAIGRPKRATPERVTALCADCHTSHMKPVVPSDPQAIRFQATTLTWSRCYTASRGGFGCVTCHDPHSDALTSPAYYESICLKCHDPGRKPDAGAVCRVNPRDGCLKCHMPTIPDVVPHTSFTDHHIRIRER